MELAQTYRNPWHDMLDAEYERISQRMKDKMISVCRSYRQMSDALALLYANVKEE